MMWRPCLSLPSLSSKLAPARCPSCRLSPSLSAHGRRSPFPAYRVPQRRFFHASPVRRSAPQPSSITLTVPAHSVSALPRLSPTPSPVSLYPASAPLSPSLHASVLLYSAVDAQLIAAKAAHEAGQAEVVARLFSAIFSSVLSAPNPSRFEDLSKIKAAFVKCGHPLSSLPAPFVHLLIAASTNLHTLFGDLAKIGQRPTLATCDTVMATAARIRNTEDVMRALRWLRSDCAHLRLGLAEYNGFLAHFAREGDVQGAQFVYDDMTRSGMKANEDTFSHLLHACGRGEQLSMGLSLLDHIATHRGLHSGAAQRSAGLQDARLCRCSGSR